MKKIISIIMVVGLIAAIGVPAVSADSFNGGTATITYKEPDTYCVLIPETIDMTFDNYHFQALDMNLAEGICNNRRINRRGLFPSYTRKWC